MPDSLSYYNDNDSYACCVLRSRIADGSLPAGFVDERDIREVALDDIRQYRQVHLFAGIGGFPIGLKWAGWPDRLSVVTGGFPCQDISHAGKGEGINGTRSGLWAEMARIIRGIRPDYVFVENVPALLERGMGVVLGDLAACGYDAEWDCIPACVLGAPHRRDRVWIVAYANSKRFDDSRIRLSEVYEFGRMCKTQTDSAKGRWSTEPDVGRVAHGISARVDRLRCLGNAVVPQVVEAIASMILERSYVSG